MLVNDHARIQDGRNHIHDIKSHVLECVRTMLLIAHDLKPTTHAFFRATNQVVHLYWPEPQTSTLSEEIREERRKQGCCVIILKKNTSAPAIVVCKLTVSDIILSAY